MYTDASWKVNNTYAGVIIFFNNGAVDWVSKLMKVKMSSPEAEIAAGCIGGKRMVYIRNLLARLSKFPELAITHVVDNSAMIPLTENVGASAKTEHFMRWMHYLRGLVVKRFVYMHLEKTKYMYANPLTKVDTIEDFLRFRKFSMNE